MKRYIAAACAAIAFALAFVSGGVLLWQYLDKVNSLKSFEELSDMTPDVTMPAESDEQADQAEKETAEAEPAQSGQTEKETREAELAQAKYGVLYAENPDFVGWISIEGTKVNYPVMQTPGDPGYYLKHDFKMHYSEYGVPFVDEGCTLGVSNNVVIYGHNMKDGTMFANICKYTDEKFYEEHKIICFDTLSAFDEYEVIAVFKYDTNNETFRFNTYATMDEAEFKEFIENVYARQLYDTGVKAEYGDELLTLCTCEYSYYNGRLVVVAKKIS